MERDITRQTIVDVSIIWHTEKFKSLQLGIKKLGIKRFKVLHANQVEVLYQVMTLCYYHVTYTFESESTLCSFLNVKELLA